MHEYEHLIGRYFQTGQMREQTLLLTQGVLEELDEVRWNDAGEQRNRSDTWCEHSFHSSDKSSSK